MAPRPGEVSAAGAGHPDSPDDSVVAGAAVGCGTAHHGQLLNGVCVYAWPCMAVVCRCAATCLIVAAITANQG